MSETLSVTLLTPLDPDLSLTGAELNTRELATELVRLGHEVSLVHSYVGSKHDKPVDGFRCIGVPNSTLPFYRNYEANRGASVALRALEKSTTCDVLEVRGAGLGRSFKNASPKWRARVYHAVDIAIQELQSLPFSTGIVSLPRYLGLIKSEWDCVNSASWIVADTESVRQRYEQFYHRRTNFISAIPPALPRRWSELASAPYDPSHFLFIGAGPRRDAALFIKTLKELVDRGLRVRATVLRESRPRFLQIARKFNLDVRFVPAVSEVELRSLYASSCAFVLPSLREAYCKPVIESAFHGTPSVTSNLAPVREFVTHDETGLVMRTLGVTEWADALERLSTDVAIRNRLGREAKTRAVELYSASRMTRLTIEGYRRCMERAAND